LDKLVCAVELCLDLKYLILFLKLDEWSIELVGDPPLLAKSPDSSKLIYFELVQQLLFGSTIDPKSGDVLRSGNIYTNSAPYNCGGVVFASQNGKPDLNNFLILM